MLEKLKILDLFSGIGGFSLGLERTGGFETVAFCEREQYQKKVLKKNWPEVPIWSDVTTLNKQILHTKGIRHVDVICGGFPCQDISTAGKQVGIIGERSGLWSEFCRLIGELQPGWVIAENVANLRSRGLALVLQDLWKIGYDAEWYLIPASSLSAPHERDRIWIIAYPNSSQREGGRVSSRAHQEYTDLGCQIGWQTEPTICRVDDGLPSRMDRLKCTGNAVVPQIPYILGKAILDYETSLVV